MTGRATNRQHPRPGDFKHDISLLPAPRPKGQIRAPGASDPKAELYRRAAEARASLARRHGRHPILDIVGKLWGSGNTALGLAAALPSYAAGRIKGTDPYFQIGNNAIQLVNSPLNWNERAYTLGNVQVYGVGDGPEKGGKSYTGDIVQNGPHEEGHSRQSQFLGPLYLPAQLVGMLFGDRNPLDIGADHYALGKSRTGF